MRRKAVKEVTTRSPETVIIKKKKFKRVVRFKISLRRKNEQSLKVTFERVAHLTASQSTGGGQEQ